MVTCRYFNSPGGCNRGASCHFQHDSSARRPPQRGGHASQPPSSRSQYVPKGICREFYLTGSCHNFATAGGCRYRHTQSKPVGGGRGPGAGAAPLEAGPRRPGLDTPEALTSAAKGVNSDAISPASSHLRVDRAILFKVANEVDFKFLEPQRVYPWVNSLYASTQVKALRSTHEESQNVLADLANPDGPGMARLVEVLNFPFSCDVGESSTSKSLSFQRGFMPLVFYLTSGEIRNSVFTHHLNRIYNVLHIHARSWVPSTLTCLDAIMVEKSVKDPRLFGGRSVGIAPEDFVQVFSPLTQVLHEYLTRFPDAIVKTPQVPQLVSTLETHFTTYYEAVCSNSTAYDPELTKDPRQHRFLVEGVRQSVNTLAKVIERTQIVPFVAAVPTARLTTIPSIAALAALKRLFEPPGALRTGGPRHDNDHASIKDIQILPTHQELLSREPAFVPANLPDGPHHLPLGSMDRQIDITFRLLREDFVGPLRAAVSSIVNDLGDLGNPRNALGNLLKRGGGRYRPSSSVHADSSDLNVYARVEFAGITLSNYHELQLELELDFPRNFGRSHVARHLAQGNLVGLICRRRGAGGDRRGTVNPNDVRIFLGLVTNEAHSAPGGVGRKRVGISFFEGELYLEALSQFEAQKKGRTDHGEMICFEVPGFLLGTLKPFLKALQGIEPASVPFAKYLSALPPPADDPITIEPPLFARTPGFVYDLSGSLTDKSPPGTLVLDINDEESVRAARQVLLESSRLDPSQIEALLDTSRREVALIRGPPGTGKSFLGVEIIRTLVQARIGLILILAYTNHALDTMLRHCKADVTDKIVRAGSRSQDPEMAEYNLNQLAFEQSRHQGRINHETRDLLNERKDLQKAIKAVCALSTRIARHDIEFEHLAEYLRLEFGEHLGQLRTVPASVTAASEQLGDGEWRIATGNRHAARSISVPTLSRDVFAWWRDGRDVEVLERAQDERDGVSAALARQHDEWAHHAGSNRFDVLGSRDSDDDGSESSASSSLDSDYGGLGSMFELFEDARIDSGSSDADSEDVTEEEEEEHDPRYVAPSRNRPLAELEADSDVWNYSLDERARILEAWADDLVRQEGPRINDLRRKQEDVNARLKALNNDAKLRVLQGAEIVGATTNSASNLLEIIAAAGPVVLVVEEAGECLETQVVANLVPSIQQLVMIGDEKQLRPQISSYHLSIDSSQGSVHRHDVSLFERLATLPVPVSMLRTQRRMRPEISALVRNFLYPDLEDAPQVHEYPDVKGMTKNVFFVDHRLAEDSQAIDHSSKTNTQEAIWVVDLVRHLLKQGYRAGQIAVICPYLGQLSALKRELEKETISVAIDERDAEDLAAAKEQAGVGDDSSDEDDEGEVEARFAPVQATMQTLKSQIDLRTIDRFQGEEADIVILSLTRNSASLSQEDEPTFYNLDRAAKSSIGFLKSFNRTNVAVSRAKHGMYLFGDAQLLAEKSQMWKSIVGQLEEQDLVGSRLPVGCVNHPETAFAIDAPGKLPELAPEGGCLERCNSQLPCGHACPRLCHALDPEHRITRCIAHCPTLLPCSHPCSGLCSEPHPKCTFNVPQVLLECGHSRTNIPCSLAHGGLEIACKERVLKTLPCGHEEMLLCSTDPAETFCGQVCGATLDCSHGTCKARCGDCRRLQTISRNPSAHKSHAHTKELACGHTCKGDCESHVKAGVCPSTCSERCPRSCSHGECNHSCATECPGCLNPCDSCSLPCSSPCNVLLSDKICQQVLKCGHRCPSLASEDCSRQVCPKCATPDRRGNVVDFILMTTLGDFDEADPDPLSKLITVDCGHSLSIETLDGLFEIDLFYVKDEEGKIVGLAHPETSDKVPARCPSCKTAITSNVVKRYGRSLKHREATVQAFVESVPKTKILESARNFKVTSFGKVLVPVNVAKENQRRFLKKCDYPLIPSGLYHDKNFTGLPSTLHNFWTSKTRQVISGLYRLGQAGSRQSPQSKAYQAAITQLYFEEKDRLLASNEPVRDLDRSALEYAHRSAGMAPPTVDIKLQVQHVWLSLDLRSTLASFAAQLAEVVWKHRPEKGPVHQALVNLAGFVYKCSLRDVEHTIDLAESRSCGRLAIEGRLRRLQVLLAYNAFLSRSQLAYNFASRPTVLKVIEKAKQQALSDFDSAVDQFAAEQPLNRGWIDEEILPNRDNICKQWNGLLQSAREATVYEPVTEEELKIVIQSQKFATSSHWYTCPNGHSYAIGDCSGAVVEARCHECSAVIGGTGHRVSEGNHHDERMIRLAEQAGARPEFSWGRQ